MEEEEGSQIQACWTGRGMQDVWVSSGTCVCCTSSYGEGGWTLRAGGGPIPRQGVATVSNYMYRAPQGS